MSQVWEKAETSIAQWLPNVVLINAGTNDATQNHDVSGTGARMKIMINGIFARVPTAVVVLSTLLPHLTSQDNVNNINNQYRELYWEYNPRAKDGKVFENPDFKVVLADMSEFIFEEHIKTLTDDKPDNTHTTEEGERHQQSLRVGLVDTAQ